MFQSGLVRRLGNDFPILYYIVIAPWRKHGCFIISVAYYNYGNKVEQPGVVVADTVIPALRS